MILTGLLSLSYSNEKIEKGVKSIFQKFVRLGHHPEDTSEERLKKSSLLVVAGPFACAGIIWGLLYFYQGLTIPAAIPFCYGILSCVSMIHFGLTKRYVFFRNSQLVLILILPFALQVSLGGFVPSSAVMYWAIICPASAMFFDSVKRSVYWFAAYLLLIVLAYLINDFIPAYVNWELSESFINSLFLMNMIGVSSIVFGILYYFVSTITNLNREIENKNQALWEQSEKLKEMDEVKSRFFANISHEFRTPLTLILGLARKQRDQFPKPPEIKDSDTTIKNANHLLQLINQLLDLSKLESGELKLSTKKQDLVLFIKNSSAQFESLASRKNLKLYFNGEMIEEPLQGYQAQEIYFDPDKMHRIIINLLSNAIKFTPEGESIRVEVEVANTKEENSGKAHIRVINTGVQIPADKLPHLFDRFYQVDSGANRRFEGTGIGLALVKELVELHDGQVNVESKMKKVQFNIEIPTTLKPSIQDQLTPKTTIDFPLLSPSSQFQISEPRSTAAADSADYSEPSRLQVLVVEDNSDLRSYIVGILSTEYQVVEAKDGMEGLEMSIEIIPDLIVSDVMMPRMDGFELCQNLKTDDRTNHIPIILLTAKAAKDNKLEGLDLGADDYLTKPFDERELRIRIRNLISVRKKLQEKFQSEIGLRPTSVEVTSVQQKFLDALKEIVETNIDNELFGVDDLSREIGMSRSQIHRKLKALTDQSATTYIRNYRLHRSVQLLEQNAGNITEIAHMVGFNSQTYFSSCFQELFGTSPSAYKARKSGIN